MRAFVIGCAIALASVAALAQAPASSSVIEITVPPGTTSVPYGAISFRVDPGGTLSVPRYVAPTILARPGFARADGQSEVINIRAEIAKADLGSLETYLQACRSPTRMVDGKFPPRDRVADALAIFGSGSCQP